MNNKKVKIDIACGDNKKGEDFIGVDKIKNPSVDIVHDLNVYPWPFEDNSVDEIVCSHYIEHIPHDINNGDDRDGFIQFMDEVYRILKPGGTVKIVAPYVTNVRAFGDPTHRRYIHDWSFFYYNKEWRDANKLSHYGIECDFDMTFSYLIDDELTLKSSEVREEFFKKYWNSILEIIVVLTKRENKK